MAKFDYYTIEPQTCEYTQKKSFAVYGHGIYENTSVLAGQYRRCFIDNFNTIEEAQKAYPDADESGSTKINIPMSDCPPSDFDPADAGEVWHEEDY